MFCARMAIRLVPLAIGPGTPMNSITGTVSSEPPPASTFSQPASTPTRASNEDLRDFHARLGHA